MVPFLKSISPEDGRISTVDSGVDDLFLPVPEHVEPEDFRQSRQETVVVVLLVLSDRGVQLSHGGLIAKQVVVVVEGVGHFLFVACRLTRSSPLQALLKIQERIQQIKFTMDLDLFWLVSRHSPGFFFPHIFMIFHLLQTKKIKSPSLES